MHSRRSPAPEPRPRGGAALSDYAGIGDGRTVALIARDGRIDWLPVPALDTPPLFAAILDEERGGRFELAPTEPFTSEREYVEGTNVLRTRFTTASGVVEVTDALATGVAGRLPWLQLVRRVDGVSGAVAMAWRVEPADLFGGTTVRRFDTGHVPMLRAGTRNIALDGSGHGRIDPVHPGNGPATDWGAWFQGAFSTTAGSRHVLCLTGTDDEPIRVPDPDLADGVHRVRARGWRGIGPVLSGNGASGQLQLGTYADLLSLLAAYLEDGNVIDGASSDLLVQLADDACVQWPKKDAGLWELTKARHYVSSKMGCWQALDSAIRLHDLGYVLPPPGRRERWEKNRRLIERWVERHGWNERRGAYVMYKGGRKLDASVLLHSVSGFDRGPRMSRTIDAIRAELGAGPLVWRYSGMQREEGTFVACAFWVVSALACVGRVDEARPLMDELVARANDVGLYSEMIDADTGEFLGNLPQALSHLALVNAAATLRELG